MLLLISFFLIKSSWLISGHLFLGHDLVCFNVLSLHQCRAKKISPNDLVK